MTRSELETSNFSPGPHPAPNNMDKMSQSELDISNGHANCTLEMQIHVIAKMI